jgi:hypothetical protein
LLILVFYSKPIVRLLRAVVTLGSSLELLFIY